MLNEEGLEFILKVTDYFHGHWEDPEWGKRPVNQLLILLGAHTLIEGVADPEVQARLQEPVERAMGEVAMRLATRVT